MRSRSHTSGGRSGRGVPHRQGRPNHRVRQLCRQVERTLNYLISGECDDDLLRDLYVQSVIPFPDEGSMLVTLAPLSADRRPDPAAVLAHLAARHDMLRAEVAGAVHRRRAPDWRYRISSEVLVPPLAANGDVPVAPADALEALPADETDDSDTESSGGEDV